MKKRFISLFLAFAMLIAVVPVLHTAEVEAAASINIGDYVQMGTYYGEPILWRCVDIDENGPLMLSDRIICLKPFDARTSSNSSTGSHSRGSGRASWGSNYWADSNMRSWLNSSESAGNVTWLCGNPPSEDYVWNGYNDYANEAGFLTNFTQSELNAIKTVTQKSIVAHPEYENGIYDSGSEVHSYHSSISSVVANYDSAYSEQVTDTMFLLDVKQVNAVYNNGSILGSDYYIGKPTEQCVSNSEYTSPSLSATKNWDYWLRSPDADYNSSNVRYVYSDGSVLSSHALTGGYGVRPAFYLNLSSCTFVSGSGTAASPYTVTGSGGGATPTPAADVYEYFDDPNVGFVYNSCYDYTLIRYDELISSDEYIQGDNTDLSYLNHTVTFSDSWEGDIVLLEYIQSSLLGIQGEMVNVYPVTEHYATVSEAYDEYFTVDNVKYNFAGNVLGSYLILRSGDTISFYTCSNEVVGIGYINEENSKGYTIKSFDTETGVITISDSSENVTDYYISKFGNITEERVNALMRTEVGFRYDTLNNIYGIWSADDSWVSDSIVSVYPVKNSVLNLWDSDFVSFTVTFDSDIEAGNGCLYLNDYDTDQALYVFTKEGDYNSFWADGNTLYIYADLGQQTIPCGEKLYITMDTDAVVMEDGSSFEGITNKDTWSFTTAFGLTKFSDRVNFLNRVEDFFYDYNSESSTFPISSDEWKSKMESIIGKLELKTQMRKRDEFSGACFGISFVTALYKLGMLDPTEYDSSASTLYDMKMPKDSTQAGGVRDLINYYYLLQRVDKFKLSGLDTRLANWFRDEVEYKNTLKEIVDHGLNMDTNKTPLLINFGWMDGNSTSQHSVVLCSARENDDGSFSLLIKDPNMTNLSIMTVSSDYSSLKYYSIEVVTVKTIDVSTTPSDWLIGGSATASLAETADTNTTDSTDDYDILRVIAYGNFKITNSEGETLIYDSGKISGTMDVLDEDFIESGVGSYAELVYKVNKSEGYTFEPDDTHSSCTLKDDDNYISVSAQNASNIVMNKSTGVSIQGSNLVYSAITTTASGNNLFAVSGETAENFNISVNDDGTAEISADTLTNVTFDSLYEDVTYVIDGTDNTAKVLETEEGGLELEGVQYIETPDWKYTINDITTGNNAVSVNVMNNSGDGGTLIVASYDEKSVLLDIKILDLEIDSLENIELALDDATYIKAYVWDDVSSMVPISESKTVNL